MLPAIAALMSPSSGLGIVASRAAADMICPDWHRSRETEYIAKNPKQWHIRRDVDVKRFAIDGRVITSKLRWMRPALLKPYRCGDTFNGGNHFVENDAVVVAYPRQ